MNSFFFLPGHHLRVLSIPSPKKSLSRPASPPPPSIAPACLQRRWFLDMVNFLLLDEDEVPPATPGSACFVHVRLHFFLPFFFPSSELSLTSDSKLRSRHFSSCPQVRLGRLWCEGGHAPVHQAAKVAFSLPRVAARSSHLSALSPSPVSPPIRGLAISRTTGVSAADDIPNQSSVVSSPSPPSRAPPPRPCLFTASGCGYPRHPRERHAAADLLWGGRSGGVELLVLEVVCGSESTQANPSVLNGKCFFYFSFCPAWRRERCWNSSARMAGWISPSLRGTRTCLSICLPAATDSFASGV
ncbi:hypothetical protein R3P38DRAFT_1763417 [Favolaschia claudopus]|uniref:Uncharacterized protein n=1 Tax=Favolaschia claudopus TaxID=2862362 RepID=A0AAW0DD28_9AGAR